MDEFHFISTMLAPLATDKGALGLKDDAAVLAVPADQELVITKDAISAGVHFIGDEPPELIARKLLAVNLSDLAAMGAKPWGYFLALMLPSSSDEKWLAGVAAGLKAAQSDYDISLMGGDTTCTRGPLALSVTALGLVPKGGALLRRGATAGDGIYVSGTLGDAALGLAIAQGKLPSNDFLLSRYRLPQPRVALGKALRGIASACMDISDGLMQDLGHLCAASGVGAEVRYADIPLSDAGSKLATHESVLAGGDDYELLFTVPAPREARLVAAVKNAGTPVARIGTIREGAAVQAFDAQGREIILARKGYSHF